MKRSKSTLLFCLCAIGITASAQTSMGSVKSAHIDMSMNKTFHIIFPAEIKYFSIGDENVAGERIEAYPRGIRLKAIDEFEGATNMSVVTADGQYYEYQLTYSAAPIETYQIVGKEWAIPDSIDISELQKSHLIFPEEIIYVDYGTEDVEAEKASGVNNILAVRATNEFVTQTNITAITASGKFYTFNLGYSEKPGQLSFIIEKKVFPGEQRVALLDNKELNSVQREELRKTINSRFQSISKLYKDYAGIRFAITNIFIDKDILFFKFKITNYSNIDYVPDFVRFYIQDAKVKKKTAIQQIEQIPMFFFDMPDRVAAHDTHSFTVALNKFTIPDKKKLIIEMQERDGGRHFFYKLGNEPIISAEILHPTRKQTLFQPNKR
jgi:conjugative transposon TraN protein